MTVMIRMVIDRLHPNCKRSIYFHLSMMWLVRIGEVAGECQPKKISKNFRKNVY